MAARTIPQRNLALDRVESMFKVIEAHALMAASILDEHETYGPHQYALAALDAAREGLEALGEESTR